MDLLGRASVEMVTRGSAGFPGGKVIPRQQLCVFSVASALGRRDASQCLLQQVPIGGGFLPDKPSPPLPASWCELGFRSLGLPLSKGRWMQLCLTVTGPKTPRNKPNLPEKSQWRVSGRGQMGDTQRVCDPVSPLLASAWVETVKRRKGKGLVPTSRKKSG